MGAHIWGQKEIESAGFGFACCNLCWIFHVGDVSTWACRLGPLAGGWGYLWEPCTWCFTQKRSLFQPLPKTAGWKLCSSRCFCESLALDMMFQIRTDSFLALHAWFVNEELNLPWHRQLRVGGSVCFAYLMFQLRTDLFLWPQVLYESFAVRFRAFRPGSWKVCSLTCLSEPCLHTFLRRATHVRLISDLQWKSATQLRFGKALPIQRSIISLVLLLYLLPLHLLPLLRVGNWPWKWPKCERVAVSSWQGDWRFRSFGSRHFGSSSLPIVLGVRSLSEIGVGVPTSGSAVRHLKVDFR